MNSGHSMIPGKGSNEILMNTVYFSINVISLIMFLCSFRRGVDLRITLIPMILLMTEHELKFIGFEDKSPTAMRKAGGPKGKGLDKEIFEMA